MRWKLELEEYDYDIVYKKGKCNGNADTLSRIQINVTEQNELMSILANIGQNEELPELEADEVEAFLEQSEVNEQMDSK